MEANLLLLAAVCYQANMRTTRRGNYVLPRGFNEVISLTSDNYPLAGFIIESPSEIVVAFRGTEEAIDVITDLDWFQIPYPFVENSGWTDCGFTKDYQSIRNDVIQALKKLSTNKRLFITGHSLGAAIATLAALDIATNTAFTQPHVYTYASPRVGNFDFANMYNQTIHHSLRVVNTNDLIPHFPPTAIPFLPITYRHVEKKYPIGFQNFSISGNHEIANYFCRLSKMFKQVHNEICRENPKLCPPYKG